MYHHYANAARTDPRTSSTPARSETSVATAVSMAVISIAVVVAISHPGVVVAAAVAFVTGRRTVDE
jgi:hypothetical protein